MSPRKFLLLIGAAVAFVATPKIASATPNGSDSGCSGKTGIPNDVCTSCGNCHTGGPKPSVAFGGPATLNSGATATYTFTVNTSLPATGVDIAATTGIVLAHGANTQDAFGELTQPSPQPTVAGATTYSFTVTGPQYAGTIMLWASGMASNNSGGTGGDGASESTMSITVTGPPNPGAGGATGVVDAGDGTGLNGGFAADGGAIDVD
ncbi:MAG: choice-of-anchor V domain-containing protein, partial [Polyangiaceae bacterium]